jgi:hypothetical protein
MFPMFRRVDKVDLNMIIAYGFVAAQAPVLLIVDESG